MRYSFPLGRLSGLAQCDLRPYPRIAAACQFTHGNLAVIEKSDRRNLGLPHKPTPRVGHSPNPSEATAR